MSEAAEATIDLSVILPCYNEEENVAPLTAELEKVLDGLGLQSEILFVDDASSDRTPHVLHELATRHRRVRVVRHHRNFGESAAQATGFRHARGDTLVTMDSDGQNDPADIPTLVALLEEADAVCGVRRRREDDWLRRLSSRVANGFRNAVTGEQIADAGCTYRALRRSALVELPVFNGMHRFLPTLLRIQGFRVVETEVHHRPRTAGTSKYGVGNRLWRGIADCLAMRWWRGRAVHANRARGAAATAPEARPPESTPHRAPPE